MDLKYILKVVSATKTADSCINSELCLIFSYSQA